MNSCCFLTGSDLPSSCSLVLVNFPEREVLEGQGQEEVQVVMGHMVEEVEVLQEADPETCRRLQACFLPPGAAPGGSGRPDPEALARQRDGVRHWLEQNRVPVQEEGEELWLAGGVLTIAPPYGPSDCSSANQIVLDRIQKLLGALKPQNP